ncbi:Serine phosphatase RsbU, regulator of sigma subunit [Deinococcus gobiensis I-0]|uniref:Serine phosphatase RsbU, regulator of sigma subunit n=2 Tax=Deinococcus TaxID=1298 RepID=H8GX61_DEIGI|nr:Serine phosphatase RsbU, regulator of sigma subunit [Deinococcus gobiensis I-0]
MVILDYNMPKLNGAEVLTRLRQDERLSELKVVMLTTSRSHEAQIRALRADDYLIKPEGVDAAQAVALKLAAHWQ